MTHNRNEGKVFTCLISLVILSMLIIDYRVMVCSLVFALIALLVFHFDAEKIVSSMHEFIHTAHMFMKDKCTSRLNEFLMGLAFLWTVICFVIYIYLVVSFIF